MSRQTQGPDQRLMGMSRRRFICWAALSLSQLPSRSRAQAAQAAQVSGATKGATNGANHDANEIRLGMSTALSGPAADLGKDMQRGVLLGIARQNRTGGVQGRPLRLITLDDGYEPARTVPNMRRLAGAEDVIAIVGNVGTPTAIAAVPIAQEEKTLLFAAYTGAGVLRKDPPDRYVINYRASYAEETGALIDTLVQHGGLRPQDIAFFTQRDGYGDAGYDGGMAALARHGMTDAGEVLHVRYERNTLAVEGALATLLYADRQHRAIVMVGAYAPCAKFIRLAHQAGLRALFLNVSFVGSRSLAAALAGLPARVIVTQVVPHPGDATVKLVRDYLADAGPGDPGADSNFGALEGYVSARLLTTALDRLAGPPSREGLIDALEKMGEFDLGLGTPLSLGPRQHQACHHVWPTLLRGDAFVAFSFAGLAGLLHGGGRS